MHDLASNHIEYGSHTFKLPFMTLESNRCSPLLSHLSASSSTQQKHLSPALDQGLDNAAQLSQIQSLRWGVFEHWHGARIRHAIDPATALEQGWHVISLVITVRTRQKDW